MSIIWGIIMLVGAVLLSTVALAAISLAPFVPMWSKDLPRIFKIANLQPGETFYDLGCGNGKTVLYAAQHYQIKAKGLELAWPLYAICRLRKAWRKASRAEFYWADLFKWNISDASVIYVFGMPKKIASRFLEKVQHEAKPGTRLISYVFPIAGLTPTHIDVAGDKEAKIYLYQL